MISSIRIPLRPPYDGEAASVEGLNKVNFFFGSNGTGKTSLCRLIDDERNVADSEAITWSSGTPTLTYVFDRDFVERNFSNYEGVPGVFTMGSDSVEAQAKIDQLTKDLEKDRESLQHIESNITEAEADLESINGSIAEACWTVKKSLDSSLYRQVFKGVSSVKERFRAKAIAEYEARNGTFVAINEEELNDRLATLFGEESPRVEPMSSINGQAVVELENEPILGTPIVGKQGLNISSLIERLGNGDWVGRGRVYLGSSDGRCPFCQQVLPMGFEREIEQFFDESYRENMSLLENLKDKYESGVNAVLAALKNMIQGKSKFIDEPALRAKSEEFRRVTSDNMNRIDEKLGNPGSAVTLTSTEATLENISELIEAANKKIEAHNALIDNRDSERARVITDAWSFISAKLAPSIAALLANKSTLDKKLAGLRDSKDQKHRIIAEHDSELHRAEQSLTNVRKTADNINAMLTRFGFDRFKLRVDDSGKRYCVVRPNGELVGTTLSEGERSFLTFLYFYYLMKGSQDPSGTTEKRVVVIDDPISSMDADVLFITSSLVRSIADQAREGSGAIEQLLVFTHNVSFHREAAFSKDGKRDKATSYYTIRKRERGSTVIKCPENPVNSTYEMLWKSFFEDGCSALTAQNVARRIVENFFRLIGNTEMRNIPDGLTGDERAAAQAFLLWANSGSHNAFEDETDFNSNLSTASYRKILRLIFETAGYGNHYLTMEARFGQQPDS